MTKLITTVLLFLVSTNFLGTNLLGFEKTSFKVDLFEEKREELIFEKINFLEANLSEMKVRIYHNGEVKTEVPIITKGDPQGWGGSAVGLYEIHSGNRASFSVISEVFMPYALRYYGKYYFHGEPYYPGGKKLISSFSGGCLRLRNSDAKIIYELTEIGMPVLIIDKERDDYFYPKENKVSLPMVTAQSYAVGDLDSGFIFAQKDFEKRLPIASLTKLMTALVIAENVDLTKTIKIKEEMLEGYGSTDMLEQGKEIRVIDLFYPLLIESSNDSAEVLSYFLGKERTIDLMNQKARSILMEKTVFTDPSGYDPGNISTVKDLFYLARYLLNNRPPILEITKSNKVRSFGELHFEIDELWNKNIFVHDQTFVGGKTGFIKSSQYTSLFIFQFEKDNQQRNIAIIILGSQNIKRDAQIIYKWVQDNYFNN
jgi:hypothetical protein